MSRRAPAPRPLMAAFLVGAALLLTQCSRGQEPNPPPAGPETSATARTATTGGTVGTTPGTSGTTAATTAPASSASTAPSSSTTAGPASPTTTQPSSSSTTPPGDPGDAAKAAAYEQGYRGKCQSIWSIAPNGVLSNPDDSSEQFTINDCLADLTPTNGESYDTIDEARTAGEDDAVTNTQSLSSSGELCYQSTCWDGG